MLLKCLSEIHGNAAKEQLASKPVLGSVGADLEKPREGCMVKTD